jgi:hypothetical protein
MVRYFITWVPFVIAATLVLLALPWLGLIALMVFVLAAFAGLAALVWAIVAAPVALGRAIGLLTRGDALRAAESGVEVECLCCANPHVRINGRHVCLAVR